MTQASFVEGNSGGKRGSDASRRRAVDDAPTLIYTRSGRR